LALYLRHFSHGGTALTVVPLAQWGGKHPPKGKYSIGAGIVDSAAAVAAAVNFQAHGKGT
jgi:hypothetical protein